MANVAVAILALVASSMGARLSHTGEHVIADQSAASYNLHAAQVGWCPHRFTQ